MNVHFLTNEKESQGLMPEALLLIVGRGKRQRKPLRRVRSIDLIKGTVTGTSLLLR